MLGKHTISQKGSGVLFLCVSRGLPQSGHVGLQV